MMEDQAAVLREMLAVTQQMHTKVRDLGNHRIEEGTPVLVQLEELLAARQDLITHLEALGSSRLFRTPGNDSILREIHTLNEQIGAELEAKRQELVVTLRKVREGKKALALVREFSARKGELLDHRK
ncbi:MAG: hypothetical protein AB1374_06710 [Bacillota bacterium]